MSSENTDRNTPTHPEDAPRDGLNKVLHIQPWNRAESGNNLRAGSGHADKCPDVIRGHVAKTLQAAHHSRDATLKCKNIHHIGELVGLKQQLLQSDSQHCCGNCCITDSC